MWPKACPNSKNLLLLLLLPGPAPSLWAQAHCEQPLCKQGQGGRSWPTDPCPLAPHTLSRSTCTAKQRLRRGQFLETMDLSLQASGLLPPCFWPPSSQAIYLLG